MSTGAEDSGPREPLEVPFGKLVPGAIVDGRYRVVDRIGEGGMGSVYRVEHLRLGARFALKVLRGELATDPRMVARFEREMGAVARVTSEHVVPIVDCGVLAEGTPYFVMHLLEGRDLRALLRETGSLPPVRAVNLIIDACHGLSAVHAAGIVHRDVKPANLFVTRGDDGRDVVKVLDFGVAKQTSDATTQPGALIGTVKYMAPEQIGTGRPVDARADLFALGVILYECIAGEAPFAGDTTERVLYGIITADPVPLHERREGVPVELSRVVQRALSKRPDDRFESARAFAEALRPFAGTRVFGAVGDWERRASPEGDDTTREYDATHVSLAIGESSARMTTPPNRASRSLLLTALVVVGVAGLSFVIGKVTSQPEPAHDEQAQNQSSSAMGVNAEVSVANGSPEARASAATPSTLSATPEIAEAVVIAPSAPAASSDTPQSAPASAASARPSIVATSDATRRSRATTSDGTGPSLVTTVRREGAPETGARGRASPSDKGPPPPDFDPRNPYAE